LAHMSRRTILVVDQDHETIPSVRQALGQAYELIPAVSGADAFEVLESKSVALVLLAENPPEAQGLEVLAALKAQWPILPLVFMVENLNSEMLLAALRAGCNDVLQKPLDEAEVSACLRRILSAVLPQRPRTLQNVSTRLKQLFSASKNSTEAGTDAESITNRDSAEEEENAAPRLAAHYYGEFRVLVNERVVASWPSRKGKLLFAYLAMNHKRRISREVLMETFWPSAEPASARNSLNVALHHIRRALQEVLPDYDFILFKDECYFINPDLEVWLDVEEFKQHWKRAQCLERDHGREAALPEFELAANLYHGDFMEDEVYEGWAGSQREHFKEIYLVALDRISKVHSLNGKPALAVNLCESILTRDNCREDIHRRLMLCYYRLGKRDKALRQFKKCEEILQAELEVKPTRATFELYEKIKSGGGGKKKKIFSKN